MMILNQESIKKFLPHRDPFLFVDAIEAITFPESVIIDHKSLPKAKTLIGSKVVGHFFVRPNLAILSGHFPNNPIVPGVIHIEMMAQVSCFMIYPLFEDPISVHLEVALLGVTNSKFRKPIKPQMHLRIETELVKARSNIWSYSAQILHEDHIMSEASFMASVQNLEGKI